MKDFIDAFRSPAGWAGALLLLVILAGGTLLTPDDNSSEWAQSDTLAELQASEAGAARRQAAAQQVCAEWRGPNSEARWTAEGDLVCTTRRGLVAVNP